MDRRSRRRLLPPIAALALLAGCATAPVRPVAEWIGVLPAGATLYLAVDARAAGDLVAELVGETGPEAQDASAQREAASLVRATRRAWAAVTLAEGAPASFSLVALGEYPSCLIGRRLGASRDWQRVSSAAGTWYRSRRMSLAVSVPSRFTLLASRDGIEGLLARLASPAPASLPAEVAADMELADLVLYLPELPGGLAAAGAALPIREVWLDGTRGAERWEVTGTCNAASDRDARLLVLAVKLVLLSWLRAEGLPDVTERLKAVSVSADGPQVRLAGLAFTDAELAAVLRSLSGDALSDVPTSPTDP